jgi:hypothetical protein
MSVNNLFIENAGNISPSIDFPGMLKSEAWKIGKNRVNPGERIGFFNSWSGLSHTQGIVIDKVRLQSGRYVIIFKPDTNPMDCVDIKNKHVEKNYVG